MLRELRVQVVQCLLYDKCGRVEMLYAAGSGQVAVVVVTASVGDAASRTAHSAMSCFPPGETIDGPSSPSDWHS